MVGWVGWQSEVEVHGDLSKEIQVFEQHPATLLELGVPIFILLPLEDKELVNLLLGCNQVLAANDREILFVLALLHCNDLIRLSCFGGEQFNRDVAQDLVST